MRASPSSRASSARRNCMARSLSGRGRFCRAGRRSVRVMSFAVWGLRPLVAGVAHGFDRGIDRGLAAELEEGGVEFDSVKVFLSFLCRP